MKILLYIAALLCGICLPCPLLGDDFLLVVGEPGEATYEAPFESSAQIWRSHFSTDPSYRFHLIGRDRPATRPDREALKEYLENADIHSTETLWIVLHGHGTFDEKVTSFNLRGKDVTLEEFHEWLKPLAKRPLVFINSSASSSQFLTKLAGPNRIIITATQTTGEENYSYFGQYLASALQAQEADLDGDGSLSLLEAFLHASRSVEAHYKNENRMTTEHAILDDNADGKGTPVDFFKGIHAIQKPKTAASIDGQKAASLLLSRSEDEKNLTSQQRESRVALEKKIQELRQKRSQIGDQSYYTQLEKIALQLAEIYHQPKEEDHE